VILSQCGNRRLQIVAIGQTQPPSFVAATAELASIPDAGEHGTRFAAETTGPCPQYPSKPPPGPATVDSEMGQISDPEFALADRRHASVGQR
jgi:hypothetical protein